MQLHVRVPHKFVLPQSLSAPPQGVAAAQRGPQAHKAPQVIQDQEE